MKFAIADPPYLGCAKAHYRDDPRSGLYDTLEGHRALISRLLAEYPDGWALSMTSDNLWDLLPELPRPPLCRIGAWVKPFCAFKRGVGVAYAWEPVVFFGGRKKDNWRIDATVRDWIAANVTTKRGVHGAKPAAFTQWVLDILNVRPGDEVDDLFPGSGAVRAIIAERLKEPIDEGPLFGRAGLDQPPDLAP